MAAPHSAIAPTSQDRDAVAPASPVRRIRGVEIGGLILVSLGAVLTAVSLFLSWVAFGEDETFTFWGFSKIIDIATITITTAIAGLALASLLVPSSRALRAVLVVLSMYLAGFAVLAAEFVWQIPGPAEAGELLAIAGGAVASTGILLLAFISWRDGVPPDQESIRPLVLTGLILGAGAGVLVTITLLLSGGPDASEWEIGKIDDVLAQLVAAVLVGTSLTAMFTRGAIWRIIALLASSYVSLYVLLNGIENIAQGNPHAADYMRLVTGVAAITAAVLMAISAFRHPVGPRPADVVGSAGTGS